MRRATEFCSSLKSSSSSYKQQDIAEEKRKQVRERKRKGKSSQKDYEDLVEDLGQESIIVKSLYGKNNIPIVSTSSTEVPSRSLMSPFINANNTSTCKENIYDILKVKVDKLDQIDKKHTLSAVVIKVLFFIMLWIITIAMTLFVPSSR